MTVLRIDRFELPAGAAATFLARIEETHAVLRGCDGFLGDRILVGCDAPSVMTIVEWRDDVAVERAKSRVLAARAGTGFDPQSYMRDAGITAVFSTFAPHSDAAGAAG